MEKKDKVIYIFSPYGITIYRSYKEDPTYESNDKSDFIILSDGTNEYINKEEGIPTQHNIWYYEENDIDAVAHYIDYISEQLVFAKECGRGNIKNIEYFQNKLKYYIRLHTIMYTVKQGGE